MTNTRQHGEQRSQAAGLPSPLTNLAGSAHPARHRTTSRRTPEVSQIRALVPPLHNRLLLEGKIHAGQFLRPSASRCWSGLHFSMLAETEFRQQTRGNAFESANRRQMDQVLPHLYLIWCICLCAGRKQAKPPRPLSIKACRFHRNISRPSTTQTKSMGPRSALKCALPFCNIV